MDTATRALVRSRASERCEYCHMPEQATPLIPFHVEHIIAQQHVSDDSVDNLALACDRCNAFKGPNLSSIDPTTGEVAELFHPRIDHWNEHVTSVGGQIVGLTPRGRATVHLLVMNAPRRVELRQAWLSEGGEL